MASKFKKTVSTFPMKKLPDARSLGNAGAQLTRPLSNVSAQLALLVARAWLRYLLPFIRRYILAVLGALIGVSGAIMGGRYFRARWKKGRRR
jgi:hypothetical protein